MLRGSMQKLSCCASPGNGVVYEVCVNFLDKSITDQYTQWLVNHHVEEVLRFPGFSSAEVLRVHQSGDVIVRYALESLQVFDKYDSSDVAKKLRNDAREVFGDKFQASRRVLVSQSMHFK